MDDQQYYDFIQQHYQPLHPHLYTLQWEFFVEPLLQALANDSPDSLSNYCQQPHPGVYVFDMLKPDYCQQLLAELAHFETWCDHHQLKRRRPNTMNNYGVILNGIGFEHFLHQLMSGVVTPFARLFYADVGGDSLDSIYGFTVEYQQEKDLSLDFHVDASDVTLNVCLGTQFTGGDLYLRGVRCAICQQTPPLPSEKFDIDHMPGRAILHRGKHRHGARSITSGQRTNLILWCNSSSYDEQQDLQSCQPWCGCSNKHHNNHINHQTDHEEH